MDAVKFLKEKARMTNECNILCDDCPVHAYCNHSEGKNAERMVAIVEKWAEEHPVKTRQSEFLKMFPNVPNLLDMQISALKIWVKTKESPAMGNALVAKRNIGLRR